MSRLIDRPLAGVRTDAEGYPLRFNWQGRRWTVARAAEVWKDVGRWWEGEGEKTFFRLETTCGRLCEVYLDHKTGKWFIYHVYD